MQKVDLDGGDLGLGDFPIQLHEFPFVVKISAKILSQARKFVDLGPNERLSYAIRVPVSDSKLMLELIRIEEKSLPVDIRFYDVDDKKLFELRGQSGGVISQMVCYLITKS